MMASKTEFTLLLALVTVVQDTSACMGDSSKPKYPPENQGTRFAERLYRASRDQSHLAHLETPFLKHALSTQENEKIYNDLLQKLRTLLNLIIQKVMWTLCEQNTPQLSETVTERPVGINVTFSTGVGNSTVSATKVAKPETASPASPPLKVIGSSAMKTSKLPPKPVTTPQGITTKGQPSQKVRVPPMATTIGKEPTTMKPPTSPPDSTYEKATTTKAPTTPIASTNENKPTTEPPVTSRAITAKGTSSTNSSTAPGATTVEGNDTPIKQIPPQQTTAKGKPSS